MRLRIRDGNGDHTNPKAQARIPVAAPSFTLRANMVRARHPSVNRSTSSVCRVQKNPEDRQSRSRRTQLRTSGIQVASAFGEPHTENCILSRFTLDLRLKRWLVSDFLITLWVYYRGNANSGSAEEMQLESLKIFCDVVRWASFSRGAAENGISQSSASQAVHHLEVRLGTKLIDRSKRPLVVTPQGKLYYEGCRELVDRYLDLEQRVRAVEGEDSVEGTVGVAAIYSVGLNHMSRYVKIFEERYPRANVRVEYLHPSRVSSGSRAERPSSVSSLFPRNGPT